MIIPRNILFQSTSLNNYPSGDGPVSPTGKFK